MILFAPSGPQFLWLYIGLLGVALVVAAVLRQALRAPSGDPGDVSLDDPYQVAYLVGGARTAVDLAIVTLVGRNAIAITPTRRFAMADPQAAGADPLERAVLATIAARAPGLVARRSGVSAGAVRGACWPELRQLRERLARLGLVMTPGQQAQSRILPALVLVAVGAVGLVRLIHGAMVNHPIGYLTILLITTGAIALLFAGLGPPRSRRGDYLAARLQRFNAALRSSIGELAAAGAVGPDVMLAVALYGPAVLAGTDLGALSRILHPSSGGGGGGGCGGGGCGGGGCGGGCGGA
jgi:uncharacterized protein (TIGR04222 family)